MVMIIRLWIITTHVCGGEEGLGVVYITVAVAPSLLSSLGFILPKFITPLSTITNVFSCSISMLSVITLFGVQENTPVRLTLNKGYGLI